MMPAPRWGLSFVKLMRGAVHILVADDDPILGLLLRLSLEARGHEVSTVTNGREVIDLTNDFRPDAIILDVMMPELNGFETVAKLRMDPAMADVPVVLLSARVAQEDRRRGLESGATEYVIKPFDPDQLGALVEELASHNATDNAHRREERLVEIDERESNASGEAPAVAPRVSTKAFDVLDLAVDAIVSIDTSQFIVAFNKGAEAMFGYLAEEVIGKPLDRLLPERVANHHARHVERFAASSDSARLMGERQEIFGRRKDGTEFPAEASIAKVELDGRQIMTAILRDVTEQRRAQEELRARAKQQAAVADLGQQALAGLSIDDLLQESVRVIADVLQADSVGVLEIRNDELYLAAGNDWPDFTLTGAVSSGARTLAAYTLQQDEPVVIKSLTSDTRFDLCQGLVDAGLTSGITETIKGVNTAFGVLAIFTKEKHEFKEDDAHFVQSIANTLAGAITREKAEERVRMFLESAPDATIVVNADGRMVSVNEQAEKLFGYSRSELLNMSVDDLVPDQIRDVHAAYRKQFDNEPRTRPMGAGLNLLARRKDGSEVPVDILLRPLFTDEGHLVVAAIRDVTERRRAEQVRDAFLHAVSHDLRTPLTAVVGFSSLLRKPQVATSPEDATRYAELIHDAAKRLETLLGDLLDLDRLSRGVIRPHRRDLDLVAMTEQVAGGLTLDAHPLQIDIDDTAKVINADPAQVERIIENLLVNVTRHCPRGTHVWVRARRSPNGVLVSVEDAGPGVSDELKQTLFEPFRRGDHDDASPGSGIGLSLVAPFAELHDGRAWVEDRDGGGAAFRVLLRNA